MAYNYVSTATKMMKLCMKVMPLFYIVNCMVPLSFCVSKTQNILLTAEDLRVSCTQIYTMAMWVFTCSLLHTSASEEHTVSLKMQAVHSSEALVLHCTILEICITRIKEQTLSALSHSTEKYII